MNRQKERTMRKSILVMALAVAVLAVAVVVPVGAAFAGTPGTVLLANQDGGGGADMHIDLAVRQVTVTPVRARVGEAVHVVVLIENRGEGMQTTDAELLVNGKPVARQLFTWGESPGQRLYRLSFDWDTRGIVPGEYRIGAQAFVWEDASPFDNRLDVTQPVVIAPATGEFPGGGTSGGSATETDPRFGKSLIGG